MTDTQDAIERAQAWLADVEALAEADDDTRDMRVAAAFAANGYLSELGPPSVALAVALAAHDARGHGEPVPWKRDHECEWCAKCVARMWDMTADALAEWAQAAGERGKLEP